MEIICVHFILHLKKNNSSLYLRNKVNLKKAKYLSLVRNWFSIEILSELVSYFLNICSTPFFKITLGILMVFESFVQTFKSLKIANVKMSQSCNKLIPFLRISYVFLVDFYAFTLLHFLKIKLSWLVGYFILIQWEQ